MADRDISVSGWQAAWVTRTDPMLNWYSVALSYTITSLSIFLSARELVSLRRCRRQLLEEPSSRAATFARCEMRMLKATRRHFIISAFLGLNTVLIWLVDAGISVLSIWNDVDANPEVYDASLWLHLVVNIVSMLALFVFVFMVFPMIQLMICSWAFAKYRNEKNNPDRTLAVYIPQLRSFSTQLAQMWMMLCFFLMAFWPVFYKAPIRLTLVEALYGSGLAWSQVSAMLIWRSEEVANIEITPEMAVHEAVKLYGRQWITLPLRKANANVLPRFDGEKQALLAGHKS